MSPSFLEEYAQSLLDRVGRRQNAIFANDKYLMAQAYLHGTEFVHRDETCRQIRAESARLAQEVLGDYMVACSIFARRIVAQREERK